MTITQAKQLLPIITAFAEGKTIQHVTTDMYGKKIWWDSDSASDYDFCDNHSRYRIKPEPKLRPWKAEEVPVGAVVQGRKVRAIITAVDLSSGTIYGGYRPHELPPISLEEIATPQFLHSVDGGKTWNPCGVVE